MFPCIPQCRVQSGNVVTTSHRLLLWIPGPVSFFLLSLKIRAPQPSAFRPTAVLQIAFDSVGYCSDGYISSCDRQAGGTKRKCFYHVASPAAMDSGTRFLLPSIAQDPCSPTLRVQAHCSTADSIRQCWVLFRRIHLQL